MVLPDLEAPHTRGLRSRNYTSTSHSIDVRVTGMGPSPKTQVAIGLTRSDANHTRQAAHMHLAYVVLGRQWPSGIVRPRNRRRCAGEPPNDPLHDLDLRNTRGNVHALDFWAQTKGLFKPKVSTSTSTRGRLGLRPWTASLRATYDAGLRDMKRRPITPRGGRSRASNPVMDLYGNHHSASLRLNTKTSEPPIPPPPTTAQDMSVGHTPIGHPLHERPRARSVVASTLAKTKPASIRA